MSSNNVSKFVNVFILSDLRFKYRYIERFLHLGYKNKFVKSKTKNTPEGS